MLPLERCRAFAKDGRGTPGATTTTMIRLIAFFALILTLAVPARADDISASGRGVVRIVVIAVVDDEVVGFGHGSGFAVGPNRVVTNAHVVALVQRYPGNVVIGIVPSEGSQAFQGQLVAQDIDKDLALIEFRGERLPPLALYTGPLGEGESAYALGYPGNVDLATAQSANDYITPLTPVRTQGLYSGRRSLMGTEVMLHTASIARGNSGGPLLDRCGRVIGVNSAFTRADEGDAAFAFAISGAELQSFLRAAGQEMNAVGGRCTSIEDSLAQDRAASERAAADSAAKASADAERARQAREAALDAERERIDLARENYMAIAAFLLVLGGLSLAGAALLATKGQRRNAIIAGVAGGVLMLAALIVFLLRPTFDAQAVTLPADTTAPEPQIAATGPLVCTLIPERSRVTVSKTDDVPLDWQAEGCMNARTQYAQTQSGWQRILVPADEATVSVLDFDPQSGIYVNSRYLLTAPQMAEARRLRSEVELKQCSRNPDAVGQLGAKQSAIRNSLPALPNERLVYRCTGSE